MNLLDKIIAHKRREVEVLKSSVLEETLFSSPAFERKIISLKQVLALGNTTGIIAEFKRKSPSKGIINSFAPVDKVTADYARYGAAGLSVLTDQLFFGGTREDFLLASDNQVPVLRKEFIIDKYQLTESKAMGADVILLIAACLSAGEVKELAAYAKQLGLEVLLEIHDEAELGHINHNIDMVGINNRNLKTFEVDIYNAIALSKLIPLEMIKIAESGIDNIETIMRFKDAGYKGFLIGEYFMKESDPGKAFEVFAAQLSDASKK